MANTTGRGTFKKGDPRINRKGKPKEFFAFRELAVTIAHEVAKQGDKPLIIDGHIVTVAEAILRKWAMSSDARLQQAFIAYAFGTPPQRAELTGKDGDNLKITVEYVNRSDTA